MKEEVLCASRTVDLTGSAGYLGLVEILAEHAVDAKFISSCDDFGAFCVFSVKTNTGMARHLDNMDIC
jgi:hypothetical protein